MSRPLTIAIDGRELAGRPTGVGTYVAGVLRQWAQTDFPHALHLIAHAAPPAWVTALPLRLTVTILPDEVAGTRWEQLALPRAVRRTAADVLLAPAYTAPLRLSCPFVLIVHDVSFFAQPDGFRWREGLRRRWLTRASARRAASVLTDSDFSAREITRYLGIDRHQVTVAPQGVPDWTGGPAAAARDPHVLSVGTLFNRRHVPELLGAFAQVRRHRPDARLTLVGQNRTHPRMDVPGHLARLQLTRDVTWHPYVGADDLDALYRSARVFAFLSDYEGFGMTPLEAAARGVPSVVLDTEVAREVYADGAVAVPLQTPAIADAIRSLLDDDGRHADVVARGRARLGQFPWSRTAAVVREALERACR